MRNKRIKLFKISHKEKPDFILDISDAETYLKTYLIYNLYKGEKYDYVALIKTDAIWCENKVILMRFGKINEESSLLYAHLKESLREYNNNIHKIQFVELINKIQKLYEINKEDAISLYFKDDSFNTMIPAEDAGLFRSEILFRLTFSVNQNHLMSSG